MLNETKVGGHNLAAYAHSDEPSHEAHEMRFMYSLLLVAMKLRDAAAVRKVAAFAGILAAGAVQRSGVFADRPAVIQDVAGTSDFNQRIMIFYA